MGEEKKSRGVGMSYCKLWLEWVGGWVGGTYLAHPQHIKDRVAGHLPKDGVLSS